MTVRNCVIIAIEGSHATGKTTLIHALVAYYRSQGVLVGCTGEPARTSPFIEEIVIHGKGSFDLATEVDLFAAQLMEQLRATRHQQLLVCDKTIMNILAYARLVLDLAPGTRSAVVLEAMRSFCKSWAFTYDQVYYCADQYQQDTDRYRDKVVGLQDAAAQAVREECGRAGVMLQDVPYGLSVEGRVGFVSRHVDRLLASPSRSML